MIKSIAEFSLQFTSVHLNLLVSFLKVSEARLLQNELILHFFEFLHRRCLLKLVKESAHLHDGAGLPLFQLVDTVLNKYVSLVHVGFLGVVLASEHLLLFLKVVVLASEAEQAHLVNRVLLGQVQ